MNKNRNIPFGYCIINGEYALNKIESEAVKHIFKQYIDGNSLKEIAEKMTVPYNKNKPIWNKNMVKRILENRKYTGENGFVKIISLNDFEKAERIKINKNTRIILKEKPEIKNNFIDYKIIYKPDEKILLLTKEINYLIDSDNSDKEKIKSLIIECAAKKYNCCKYAERSDENGSSDVRAESDDYSAKNNLIGKKESA